jgi:hypothetical protein
MSGPAWAFPTPGSNPIALSCRFTKQADLRLTSHPGLKWGKKIQEGALSDCRFNGKVYISVAHRSLRGERKFQGRKPI